MAREPTNPAEAAAATGAEPPAGDQPQRRRRGGGGGSDRDRARRDSQRERERGEGGEELQDKLVAINRVAKVVKGGRRFSFAALVVVGDQKGRVGWGAGKAREVPEAIRKATEQAKRSMIRVPMREGRTLHHDVIGEFGAGRVILRSAPPGTGIIAGGPMRAVFETLGISDVVAKCTGSTNPHNMVKATFAALAKCTSPRAVAARRGKKVSDILGPRPGEQRAAAAAAQEAHGV
ncbi:30S ribosomal protein S5 [Caldovatus aquaticus]|uniref:Small ribosomal subunit protein uS5 n=1 Tax=Caldovatus aquaticus TaxID=2865671 RepID=A0ABS7EXS4_9PROT|nr:30S ribosomal protein S5 [Caldovatus aquaticus]MBW8268149.1 30S ribosomal protein S5 [Caldovatus aquaticus]